MRVDTAVPGLGVACYQPYKLSLDLENIWQGKGWRREDGRGRGDNRSKQVDGVERMEGDEGIIARETERDIWMI